MAQVTALAVAEPSLGDLQVKGVLRLEGRDVRFGGISALVLSPDGEGLAAITDRGGVVTAQLQWDGDGRLQGMGSLRYQPLRDGAGRPLRQLDADAEGLTRKPGGDWVVSLERRHRLLVYSSLEKVPAAVAMEGPPGLARLPANGGIEALTALPDGRLVLIAESSSRDDPGAHALWVGSGDPWERRTYRAEAPFRPTGLATLPDGGLLVLERRANVPSAIACRIVYVAPGALSSDEVRGRELARLEAPFPTDNCEGIDAVALPGGRVRIVVVTDDNFSRLQQTLLMAFEWSPKAE